jgi:hypothetical protein
LDEGISRFLLKSALEALRAESTAARLEAAE